MFGPSEYAPIESEPGSVKHIDPSVLEVGKDVIEGLTKIDLPMSIDCGDPCCNAID